MKQRFFTSLLLVALVSLGTAQTTDREIFKKSVIKSEMLKAATGQLQHPKHALDDWTNGAFYAGISAAWRATKSKAMYQAMMEMAEKNQWKLRKNWYHADNIAIAQTYIDLYRKEKKAEMIAPTIVNIDRFISEPYPSKYAFDKITLWWCDALFMAPPVLVKLAAATKDNKYLEANDRLFRQCYDLLYNKEKHLFARDANYLSSTKRREKNGQLIFWGRGNGWVMGGLALLLTDLPKKYANRPFYENLFQEMAAAIAPLQQPDGMWRASLLDPESYPGGEVSGTGFLCYALAWGINHKLLDKSYIPVVEKAWAGLMRCINAEGRVGWVQPIGGSPVRNVTADSWEVYGTGAFLMAGSEVMKLKR
jgi:rhamnogalacturonyl hydrolase YesR